MDAEYPVTPEYMLSEEALEQTPLRDMDELIAIAHQDVALHQAVIAVRVSCIADCWHAIRRIEEIKLTRKLVLKRHDPVKTEVRKERAISDEEIVQALRLFEGNRAQAARQLKMSGSYLRKRVVLMKEDGIDVPESIYKTDNRKGRFMPKIVSDTVMLCRKKEA
jgi:hypothetical protein